MCRLFNLTSYTLLKKQDDHLNDKKDLRYLDELNFKLRNNNDYKQHGQPGPDLDQTLKKQVKFSTEITHGSPDKYTEDIIDHSKYESE